jgi:hypothetical protein
MSASNIERSKYLITANILKPPMSASYIESREEGNGADMWAFVF